MYVLETQNADRTPSELNELGQAQRLLCWVVLLQLIVMVMLFVMKPFGADAAEGSLPDNASTMVLLLIVIRQLLIFVYIALTPVGFFWMAKSLQKPRALLYAFWAYLPLINLISLLLMNAHATRVLRQAGVKVLLMGADPDDLKRLLETQAPAPPTGG